MDVKIIGEGKKKSLQITIPISEKTSKSGKSTLVATTGGNKATDLDYKDKKLVVSVNAYIPVGE